MTTIFGIPLSQTSTAPTSKYLLPLMRFFSVIPTAGVLSKDQDTTSEQETEPPMITPASFTLSFSHFWKQAGMGAMKPTQSKSHDAVYAKLLVKLTQEFGDDLLGLFAYGSRVYGNAGAHSDVDVDVLIKSQRRCRRNIVIDGLEVEMFIHPPALVCQNITNDKTGIILKCYAFGRIIYDPKNIIPPLQALAKVRWDQGPTPLEPKDAWRPRYEIADLLRDLEDIDYVRNETTAHFLLVKLVERLVRIQERICHRWPEKLKRCFENWETWDPYGGHLGKRALNSSVKWSDRLCCARELALHVLGPLGGIMPTEWKMDWEEIPPPNESPIIPKIEVFITS